MVSTDPATTLSSASIGDLWDRVFGTQPVPEKWLVIATGLLALAAVAPTRYGGSHATPSRSPTRAATVSSPC